MDKIQKEMAGMMALEAMILIPQVYSICSSKEVEEVADSAVAEWTMNSLAVEEAEEDLIIFNFDRYFDFL